MDKRQEILKILSAAVLILSLYVLFQLTACQIDPTPPPTLLIQATTTPGSEATLSTQFAPTAQTPQETTLDTLATTPTANCRRQEGDVQSGSIFSEQLDAELHFWVYLPPCYHAEMDQHYPVTYLLHGLTFNEDQWLRLGLAEQMDRLIFSMDIPPFIVVLSGEPRFDPPHTSAYADALVETLIPFVDQHFRTLPEKPYRAIGGLSRGAAWSVRMGLIHYPLFGSVGAHSLPLFEVDSPKLTGWLEHIPDDDLPTFFIDIGRQDPERWTAQDFADQLDQRNVPHTWYLFNGGHSEDYWSEHLELYLRWYARNW